MVKFSHYAEIDKYVADYDRGAGGRLKESIIEIDFETGSFNGVLNFPKTLGFRDIYSIEYLDMVGSTEQIFYVPAFVRSSSLVYTLNLHGIQGGGASVTSMRKLSTIGAVLANGKMYVKVIGV